MENLRSQSEEEDFEDLLTVSAELCVDHTCTEVYNIEAYPSATVFFGDNFAVETEYYEDLYEIFPDECGTIVDLGNYSASVAFPILSAEALPPTGCIPYLHNGNLIFDKEKVSILEGTDLKEYDIQELSVQKEYIDERFKSKTGKSQPTLTKEDKKLNRLKAIATWQRKQERLAKRMLPTEPTSNARKEAAAKRIRLNGKFLKQGNNSDLQDNEVEFY